MTEKPICITIAGSDSSAGAGLQADLKTFLAHQCYGMSVITASTAQTHKQITGIHPIPTAHVVEQLEILLSEYSVSAVKTGMLANAEQIFAIAELLSQHPDIPVVVDPVLSSSTGSELTTNAAIQAYLKHLCPISTVLTPNIMEARQIFGADNTTQEIITFVKQSGCSVLLKGGHANQETQRHTSQLHDTLYALVEDGQVTEKTFSHPRIITANTHGTGCTLASSISANLALGYDLTKSCETAINYLQQRLKASDRFLHESVATINANLPMDHANR